MTTTGSLSLQNLIGLADQVYVHLQDVGDQPLSVNHYQYTAPIAPINDPLTNYQGEVLLDKATNSLIVVNRGTQEVTDFAVDAAMADKDVNLQWADALNLAQQAADYAAANGITNIYAVGHSLGGTLAQMQAAYFGWKGVTFNAYGADELYKAMPGYAISPNADITNYRTMYDVVSDASVQIGVVKTLETPDDQKMEASWVAGHPNGFVKRILNDHSLSNFFRAGTDVDGDDHIYQAAAAFDFAPSSRAVALAQNQVAAEAGTLEVVLGAGVLSTWILAPLFPRNMQDVQLAAKNIWRAQAGKDLTGMSSDLPSNPMLLKNALNPDPADNVYRAALVAGSSVVVQGGDPAKIATFTLWAPGQISGLTKDYLIARDNLVKTRVKLAGEGLYANSTVPTDDQNSYIYTDFGQSKDVLYRLVGKGPDTYSITFGTDGDDAAIDTRHDIRSVRRRRQRHVGRRFWIEHAGGWLGRRPLLD